MKKNSKIEETLKRYDSILGKTAKLADEIMDTAAMIHKDLRIGIIAGSEEQIDRTCKAASGLQKLYSICKSTESITS
jgi:hypothetical protein